LETESWVVDVGRNVTGVTAGSAPTRSWKLSPGRPKGQGDLARRASSRVKHAESERGTTAGNGRSGVREHVRRVKSGARHRSRRARPCRRRHRCRKRHSCRRRYGGARRTQGTRRQRLVRRRHDLGGGEGPRGSASRVDTMKNVEPKARVGAPSRGGRKARESGPRRSSESERTCRAVPGNGSARRRGREVLGAVDEASATSVAGDEEARTRVDAPAGCRSGDSEAVTKT
jgi:hypothetical protein